MNKNKIIMPIMSVVIIMFLSFTVGFIAIKIDEKVMKNKIKEELVYELYGNSNKEYKVEKLNTGYSLNEIITSLQNEVKQLKTSSGVDLAYPIGSLFLSVTHKTVEDVENALGGDWVVYGAGRSLVSVDSANTSLNSASKTGGIAETTLTTANLPSHRHTIPALSGTAASQTITGKIYNMASQSTGYDIYATGIFSASIDGDNGSYGTSYSGLNDTVTLNLNHSHTVTTTASNTGYNGSATAFSNYQPYITVYMYQRVA